MKIHIKFEIRNVHGVIIYVGDKKNNLFVIFFYNLSNGISFAEIYPQ